VSQDFLPFTRPSIDEETIAAVGAVLRSGWITSGPQVHEFESQLSAYCGGRPVRVMSSATGAMEIALALADVGPGDEVITSPLSWVSTANVIVRAGARPVFVDVDPVTRNIDLDKLEAAITKRTKAVIPVYLAGKPVDNHFKERRQIPAQSEMSEALSRDLKQRGFNFCGPVISYAFAQAVGMVNDHVTHCFRHAECARLAKRRP